MNSKPFWVDDVTKFLTEHAPHVSAAEIMEQVQAGALRWATSLPDQCNLWLLRLTNPLVERDEVFLGNVLFNDWLNKSLKPALESAGLGAVHPLTNNLDTAYFIIVTSASLEQIIEAYRHFLMKDLAKLLLMDDAPQQGVHGNFKNMFTFLKSDFEPFPIFAVPNFLARELEKRVRGVLQELIHAGYLTQDAKKNTRKPTTSFRTLQATMAFFYGRTSGGSGDSQSHPTFIARMVTEYGLLTASELRRAFRLSKETCPDDAPQRTYKEAVQQAVNDGTFDESETRKLFQKIIEKFTIFIEQELLDTSPERSWLLPYLRQKGKLLSIEPENYLDRLLHRVMLGEQTLGLTSVLGDRCRVCGDQQAIVEEKNILLGKSVGKFYNQMVNQEHQHSQRLCIRCALYSYLTVKQLGSTSDGKFPIPQMSNLIFHYGQHSDEEVEALGKRVNLLIHAIHEKNRMRAEHFEKIKKAPKEDSRPWTAADEKAALIEALEAQLASGTEREEDIKHLEELLNENEFPSPIQHVLSNINSAHVLNIGFGEWRLMAFAIEHLQDESDLAQRKFAHGRFVVFTLMSFLQQICDCYGPYYFQSPPRLATDQVDARLNTFYVRDQAIDALQERNRYRTASEFAFRAVGGNGRAALKDKLKLSSALEEAPLETFSDVLRDSPFHISHDIKDAKYQPLRPEGSDRIEADPAGVRGGWEYIRVYEILHEISLAEFDR